MSRLNSGASGAYFVYTAPAWKEALQVRVRAWGCMVYTGRHEAFELGRVWRILCIHRPGLYKRSRSQVLEILRTAQGT